LDPRRVHILTKKVNLMLPAAGLRRNIALSTMRGILAKISTVGIPDGATVAELGQAIQNLVNAR
jgi:hypothetical protein